MKNIKMILLGLVSIGIIYGAVFYMVQFLNKPSEHLQQPIMKQPFQDKNQDESAVVVQSQSFVVHDNEHEDDIVLDNLEESMELLESAPSKQIVEITLPETLSFVTMKFQHAGKLDENLQQAFDMLIGTNIDALLDLIAQSNNNVLSTESCKTCAIDAILKKVSKHKKLTEQELTSLQHVIAHLYRFINTMQKLTHKSMVAPEQYVALKNLNISQVSQSDLALQARRATTLAALQTLKNIDMVDRQG